MLVPSNRLHEWVALLERLDRRPSVKHVETERVRKDGHRFDVSLSISPLTPSPDGTKAYAMTTFDITERKVFEAQLKHQTLHDDLTQMPNRTLLYDRLEQSIRSARRNGGSIALLLLDLDRFKDVNDTLGHQTGDRLLQEVSVRLQGSIRRSDTAARLGGDEFAIILPDVDEEDACMIAENVHTAVRQPLILDGHRVDIDASIGIALYPTHGTDASLLLRRADIAMYQAKRSDAALSVYGPDQDFTTPSRLTLVTDLRTAIDLDQLVVHYQPKVTIRTGAVEGVEALVRWMHPEHGLIPPGEFIPLAEDSGLMEPLTCWVLAAALRQSAAWKREGLDLSVAVNLSARILQDPGFPDTVAKLLRDTQVDAGALILEITESALMTDPDRARTILTRLREMGVNISVDDFGTGYSSLAYLQQMPLDEIKIDRSFVQGMTRTGTVIVRSVIDLGRNLGLAVTAEGVENKETLAMLTRMGCTMAQGFYWSRPIPATDVATWTLRHGEEAKSADGGQQLILVVDDNPVYQELIYELLIDEGYVVITVADAEEALAVLHGTMPALVMIDVRLPGISGLELARQIRAEPRLGETVILAITASPRKEDAEYAASIGCDLYIAKPGTNEAMVELIHERLRGPHPRAAAI
jgi:diguanylate cyclase (GGDEF)-like protein